MRSFQLQAGLAEEPAIEDVAVNLRDLRAALDATVARAKAHRGFTLFTINLDHLVKMRRDPRFHQAYQRADFVTADGWPIVLLLRRKGGAFERATGADLIDPLCARAAQAQLPVYFVGPGIQSQKEALEILRRRHAGLIVAGAEAPRLDAQFGDPFLDALALRIDQAGARLCVLSLGAPKQELLADALRKRCPEVGFVCVGAALDFISGRMSRAPSYVQRLRLEWLWRMAGDPRRLAGRYLECMAFFAETLLRGAIDSEANLGVRAGPAPDPVVAVRAGERAE